MSWGCNCASVVAFIDSQTLFSFQMLMIVNIYIGYTGLMSFDDAVIRVQDSCLVLGSSLSAWIVCCCCSTCCLRRQPGHTMCQVVPGDSRAHNTMLLMSWKAARGRGDRGRPGTHQESTQYLTHTHTNTIQCVTHTGARQRIQEGRKWVVGVTRWGLHRSSTLQT